VSESVTPSVTSLSAICYETSYLLARKAATKVVARESCDAAHLQRP
jgi:hypothetical protein